MALPDALPHGVPGRAHVAAHTCPGNESTSPHRRAWCAAARMRMVQAALRQRVGDAEAQALAEDQYEARLVDQAMQLFDRATDTLYK